MDVVRVGYAVRAGRCQRNISAGQVTMEGKVRMRRIGESRHPGCLILHCIVGGMSPDACTDTEPSVFSFTAGGRCGIRDQGAIVSHWPTTNSGTPIPSSPITASPGLRSPGEMYST